MKVLFIGGTGIISSACSQLAVGQSIDLYLLNRGQSLRRVPEGTTVFNADKHDPQQVRSILGKMEFDVIVDWIAFTPEHIETDLQLYTGKTGQFIFISSASAYQTPPDHLPVTETTPLKNPFWAYSRAKIACEERLMQAHDQDNFPVTIVRPSHTYDRTLFPFEGGYTVLDRMLRGKKVIIHGDGTSLWTLTHHKDFASGFNGLLGNEDAIGETFHITTDDLLTWNQIFGFIAAAAGVELNAVHIPSEFIARHDADWGAGLLGDKSHSMIFDNSKIRGLVPGFRADIPFSQGAREIVSWYQSEPSFQVIDDNLNRQMDQFISRYYPKG